MYLPIVIIVVHMRPWVLPSRPDPWKERDSESTLLYVCTLLWSVSFLVHLIAAGTGQNCNSVCSLHQPSMSLPLFGTQLGCRFDLLLSMVRPLSTKTYIVSPPHTSKNTPHPKAIHSLFAWICIINSCSRLGMTGLSFTRYTPKFINTICIIHDVFFVPKLSFQAPFFSHSFFLSRLYLLVSLYGKTHLPRKILLYTHSCTMSNDLILIQITFSSMFIWGAGK